MILVLTILYAGLLLLIKFKVLRWTLWTKLSPLFVMVGLIIFLVFPLQFAAPSGEVLVFRYSVPIVARVGGEVIDVPVVPNVPLKKGAILFKIDPVPYQAAVDALKAQLELARTRSEQSAKLAAAEAGSVDEKQMYATQVLQFEAQLKNAQYNLDATVVRAPANGYVTNVALRPGARVAAVPLAPAMSFIDTSEMVVGMQIFQSFSRHVEVGQEAEIAFKVRPGRVVRALEILLGRYPSAEFEVRRDFVPVPPPVPAGVPSQVLERRADLVAAEWRVGATFQGVQAARLAKLPRLSLTAAGGLGSSDLLSLLNPGPGFFQAGANFFLPIDTTGAIQAEVDIATAQQEQALAAYGQSALVAFGEVENALSGERLLAERETYLASATEDSAEAYRLMNMQYEVGKIDLLSVLQVQTRWLGARSALLSLQRARLTNRINLHLALGGDFELEEGEQR